MKAIRIDFAPHSPQRMLALTTPATWLLAGLGALLLLGGIYAAESQSAKQQETQARLERLQADTKAHPAASEARQFSRISAAEADAVNGVIQQLNIPWGRMLGVFDSVTPASIALLELTPDAAKHVVKVTAEARTAEAMLGYIGKLRQRQEFGNVMLTRHEVNAEDDNKPLRFEFEASWPEAAQ